MRPTILHTVALLTFASGASRAQPSVLDDFESIAGWTAQPSDGVSLRIGRDSGRSGSAIRLDFDFDGGGGYAIARRAIVLDLPDNYELTFWVRGDAASQNLERRDRDTTWDAYTPYEHRVTGTFVRLGQLERAHALLDFFLRDQRPAGWNHWAEVVWRDPVTPKFIGDMPHTWVGSDFIRSVLDMFAYEREGDSSLVIGAGLRPEWISESPGVTVDELRTHYGPLTYSMRREGRGIRDFRVRVERGVRLPPGGLVVRPPFGGRPKVVLVDGRAPMLSPAGEIVVTRLPAEIVIRY